MLSTLLELAGLAAWTVAAYVLGGPAACLVVGGACLLFVGAVTDDAALASAVRRVAGSPVRAWRGRTRRPASERRLPGFGARS